MTYIKTTLCFLILSVATVITAQAQFTSGSGVVYTTNTTDKVSIGTTTPGAKLDVKGSGRFTDAVAAASGTGLELDYQIPSDYARILAYDRTNGAYKSLKINGSILTLNDISNGNVGIGTGTPGVKLDVKGSGRFTDAGSATSGIGLELDYIVGSDYGRILSYDRTNLAYKPLRINGSTILLNESSGGNVGIGTTAPGYRFHSVSTGNTTSASSLLYGDFYGTAIGIGSTSSANYALAVFNNMNSNGTAKTGGVQNLLFVRGDGNVGIGTNAPLTRLDVAGTIRSTTLLSNASSVTDNFSYDGRTTVLNWVD